jgi:thiamine phosphate synthase YjbQ (UPF0047 family)
MKSCFLRVLLFIICVSFSWELSAQEDQKYWVAFKDKAGVEFDPFEYFHPSAIDRRVRNGLAISDSSDFPVSKHYVNQLIEAGAAVKMKSRWLNAVCCFLSDEEFISISQFSFVKSIEEMERGQSETILCSYGSVADSTVEMVTSRLTPQVDALGAKVFRQRKLTGKGVRVAVFDAGFRKAEKRENLRHLFENNQIEETRDFCGNDNKVFHHSTHGTDVLTCLAGKTDSALFGLATDATFLLARTEYNLREPLSEEENWLAAAEWADKHGVDIISSSLGYSGKRYFQHEMDGKTSLVAKAANAAFEKGILVVISMGNEAMGHWQYVVTPADAEGVLAVGGVLHNNGIHIDFSSYGPTEDGRMKPNVCAYGAAITEIDHEKNKLKWAMGTSFSAPLVSGFAACVLQAFPEWEVSELFSEIEKSGRLYPYFDYAHGFGMPHASYFFDEKVSNDSSDSEWVKINEDEDKVKFDLSNLESKVSKDSLSNKLFFHQEDIEGKLMDYAVYEIEKGQSLTFPIQEYAVVLRAWWAGNYIEIVLPWGE